MSLAARTTAALAAVAVTAAVAGCSGGRNQEVDPKRGWVNSTIYAASTMEVGAGVTALTAIRQDRKLHTVVLNLKDGQQLWDQPATMVGRLAGLGVQPPAVARSDDGGVVVALEPASDEGPDEGQGANQGAEKAGKKKRKATLVARDARSGTKEWSRPVKSTFGPATCGAYICVSENTSLDTARFVVLDPRTGEAIWRTRGIAEVEYADEDSVVVLTLGESPALESRELRTGEVQWETPLARAVGGEVSLSGGWDFTQIGDTLVGYLGPYRQTAQAEMPGYGFFAINVRNGKLLWNRREMVRLYPSPKPSSLLLARKVVQAQSYGGFVRIDPRTGRPASQIPLKQVPKFEWWLGFSADLKTLGFISNARSGAAFDLSTGRPVEVEGRTAWSYCDRNPRPLPIVGHEGFYANAALCEFDLAAGKKSESAGPPPRWVTGSTDGWRVWHDENGAVHGVAGGGADLPGIDG